MIYLGQPFWHDDPAVRKLRTQQAVDMTAALINAGKIIFSPILYSSQLHGRVKFENNQWVRFDLELLKNCKAMLIATLPGWEDSHGLKREITFCSCERIPIYFSSYQSIVESPEKCPL